MKKPYAGNWTLGSTFADHLTWGSKYPGLDFPMDNGTDLYAIESGTVSIATKDPWGALYIFLAADNGANTWSYVHLQDFAVSAGQHVNEGQLLGHADSTGNSTGSHLHLGLIRGGIYVDPWPYIHQLFEGAPVQQFNIGDFITFTEPTNIRSGNGLQYDIQITAQPGTFWEIIGNSRPGDGYTWYDLRQWDEYGGKGGTGFAIVDYMQKIQYSPKPYPEPEPEPTDPCAEKIAQLNKEHTMKIEELSAQLAEKDKALAELRIQMNSQYSTLRKAHEKLQLDYDTLKKQKEIEKPLTDYGPGELLGALIAKLINLFSKK